MRAAPRAAVLVIGDEILSASVADQNGPYLLRALGARGVEVVEVRQVGDKVAAIAEAVAALAGRADVVVATGGVGPTHDDVTMLGVAAAFGLPLEVDAALRDLYAALPPPDGRAAPGAGARDRAAGLKMASVPRGARVHMAGPGAPAFVPVVQVANVFVLPGVPPLMRASFEAVDVWGQGPPFVQRELWLSCRESCVAQLLAEVQGDFADVQIGSYPQPPAGGQRRLRLTCRGRQSARVEAAAEALARRLPAGLLVGAGAES